MRTKTKKTWKRSLALFMTVLMAMSCFSAGLSALAAISGVPTRTDVDSYFADTPLYGAEKWDKSTNLATLTFNWNAYNSSLGYDPQPGSLTFAYPSHIYLNVGETLEAAGYMGHMTASYGENDGSDVTDFRVMLSSATWGESTRAGFSPISTLISGYGHQGTCSEGSKLMTGSSSHYDFSNDGRGSDQIISNKSGDNEDFQSDKESVVVWRSNIQWTDSNMNNFDEYVLLTGTANHAGEVTFDPSTNFTIGAAQRYTAWAWHSDNGTRFNRYLMNNGSRPETAPEENALSMTFTVYDKSELNRLVQAAVAGTLSVDPDALAAAQAVLADREVSQDDIDAAAAAIGDKMTLLVNANEPDYDATASVSTSDAVFDKTVYHYETEATDAYNSVVYAPAASSVNNDSTSFIYFDFDGCYYRTYMPTNTVLVYFSDEEANQPKSPIMMQFRGNGSNARAVSYYANATAGSNLPLENFWVGFTDGSNRNDSPQNDPKDPDKVWPTGNLDTNINGTVTTSGWVMDSNQGNKNTFRNFYNYFKYNGSGDTTAFYEKFDGSTVNMELRHRWRSGSGDDDTYSNLGLPGTVYVINYKPIYDKLADAAAAKAVIEGANAWQYTEASVKRVKATIAAMLKANPNNFTYDGDVQNQVVACANAIADAKYMLDNGGLTLEKKQGTVTFVDQVGNTVSINGSPATYTKEYGETIAANEIPQLSNAYYRTDNAQWDYSETLTWEPAISGSTILVDEPEKVYQISDEQTVQMYDVKFYSDDGTLLKTVPTQYGDYPDWGSDTPPAKRSTDDYNYEFDHWVDEEGNTYTLNQGMIPLTVSDVANSTRADLEGDNYTKYTAIFNAYARQNLFSIAHRGFSSVAPENSIPAFELAGKNDFWGAECDVQITSDGQFVICHDETLDRTTNASGAISGKTLAQVQDATIDYGANIASYSGLKIPTLEEYLNICKKYDMHAVMDLNTLTNAQLDALATLLNAREEKANFVIICSNVNQLIYLRSLMSDTPMYYVHGQNANKPNFSTLNSYWTNYQIGFDFHYSWVTWGGTDANTIQQCASAGIPLMTWTTDDNVASTTPREIDRITACANRGVRYFTTGSINLEKAKATMLAKNELMNDPSNGNVYSNKIDYELYNLTEGSEFDYNGKECLQIYPNAYQSEPGFVFDGTYRKTYQTGNYINASTGTLRIDRSKINDLSDTGLYVNYQPTVYSNENLGRWGVQLLPYQENQIEQYVCHLSEGNTSITVSDANSKDYTYTVHLNAVDGTVKSGETGYGLNDDTVSITNNTTYGPYRWYITGPAPDVDESVQLRMAAICATEAWNNTCWQVLVEWTDLTIESYCSHSNMIHHDAVPGANCRSYGTIEYWECPGCGMNFIDEEATTAAISLQGDVGPHTLTATAAAPATECNETGDIAYWTCSLCNHIFSDDAGANDITAVGTSDNTYGTHHNYTYAADTLAGSQAPAYNAETGAYTDGYKDYYCTRNNNHPTDRVVIESANYSEADGDKPIYAPVRADILAIPTDADWTPDARTALTALTTALNAIPLNYTDSAEDQQTLDDAVAALKAQLDTFKSTYLEEDGVTPKDTALNDYTILFVNTDDTVLDTQSLKKGDEVVYGGADPVCPDNDAQYTYAFTGWTPEVVAVAADATYTATFSSEGTTNTYTVTFVDEDGETVLLAAVAYDYGTAAADIAKPATPTKAQTYEYNYVFAGWDPAVVQVTADATYRATFDAEARTDADYTAYNAALSAAQGVLAIEGLDPDVATVIQGKIDTEIARAHDTTVSPSRNYRSDDADGVADIATAVANLNQIVSDYTDGNGNLKDEYKQKLVVTFEAGANTTLTVKNGDVVVNSGDEVIYGTVLTVEAAPTAAYSQNTVTVKVNGDALEGSTVTVTGAVEITTDAISEANINTYTITWTADGVSTTTTATYGSTPENTVPPRDDRAIYTYTGAWDPAVAAAYDDTEYTAVYTGTRTETAANAISAAATIIANAANYDADYIAALTAAKEAVENCSTEASAAQQQALLDALLTGDNGLNKADSNKVYTITWNVDGVVTTETYKVGALPTYKGTTPSKPDDELYSYEFTGWEPSINEVTGDQTYVAQFAQTAKSDLDEYVAYDEALGKLNNLLANENIDPDVKTAIEAARDLITPTVVDENGRFKKPGTSDEIDAVISATNALENLIAQLDADDDGALDDAKKEQITITWLMDDNSVIDTTVVAKGNLPTHADVSKAATAVYTYAFAGWTPEITAATVATSYKATFTPTLKDGNYTAYNEAYGKLADLLNDPDISDDAAEAIGEVLTNAQNTAFEDGTTPYKADNQALIDQATDLLNEALETYADSEGNLKDEYKASYTPDTGALDLAIAAAQAILDDPNSADLYKAETLVALQLAVNNGETVKANNSATTSSEAVYNQEVANLAAAVTALTNALNALEKKDAAEYDAFNEALEDLQGLLTNPDVPNGIKNEIRDVIAEAKDLAYDEGGKTYKQDASDEDKEKIVAATQMLIEEFGKYTDEDGNFLSDYKNHTLTIDKGTGEPVYYHTDYKGQIYTIPSTPSKKFYRFTGWRVVSGEGTLNGNTFTFAASDAYVKAQFEGIEYTINIDNNGDGIIDYSITKNYDNGVIIPTQAAVEKDGYTFTGWTDQKGRVYPTTGSLNLPVTENNTTITLTAQYSKNPSDGDSGGSGSAGAFRCKLCDRNDEVQRSNVFIGVKWVWMIVHFFVHAISQIGRTS